MCVTDGCDGVSRRKVLAAGAMLPLVACGLPTAARAAVTHMRYAYMNGEAAIDAYLAQPEGNRPAPLVLVLHGNGGLPADVAETAIWLATIGFVGLAVSSNSREPDIEAIPAAFLRSQAYQDRYVDDARAGVEQLRAEGIATAGPIGILGYCGGGYAGLSWCASPHGGEVGALVGIHVATQPLRGSTTPYFRPPGIEHYRRTVAPVQLHQGGADPYTPPQDLEELRRIAAEMNKPLELFVYPQAEHGFALATQSTFREGDTRLVRARAERFLQRTLQPR